MDTLLPGAHRVGAILLEKALVQRNRRQAKSSRNQRDLLRCLFVGEQFAEARPADESVEDALEVLEGHARDNGLQHELSVDDVIGLTLQHLVDVAEEAELQKLVPPQSHAL